VIDATDNFAARFLLADVCHLAGIPVVHAAAVRLIASVGAFSPEGAPCYRCLFEDLPSGEAPDCASAGVLGPVCGVAGALGANLALRRLREGTDPGGQLLTYDARTDRLRSLRVPRRRDCPLCGESPSILSVDAARYEGPSCSSPEAP
jgi:molybdopterin/thiamine biosynthesis adenylyltransferase